MGAKVIFEVDAKHAPAMAKMLEFQRVIDGTAKSFDTSFKTAQAGADKASGSVGDLAGQLGRLVLGISGFGTALGGAYTVVRLIGAEYERMKQMQLTADERKRAALPAFNQAKLNAGNFDLEAPANQRIIDRIMQLRGSANPADSFDLIGNMMSGRGALSQKETLNAAMEVARYAGERQLDNEGAKFLAGAVMDQANTDLAKGRTPNYRATLGKFEKGFGVSRSTSIQDFATHDMRAIVGLQRHYNVSQSEAIALQGAITEAMPDLTGRRGATENLLIFKNMHEAFNQLHATKRITSMNPAQFMAMSAQERIAWATGDNREAKLLRAHLFGVSTPDQDMRKAIAYNAFPHTGISPGGSLEGEAGGKEIAQSIFSPNSPIVKQWAKNVAEVFTDNGEAAAYYEQQMRQRGGPSSRYSSDMAAMQGLQAVTDWNNTRRADAGAVRKMAEDLELKTGVGAIDSTMRGMARGFRLADPTEGATYQERRRIAAEAQFSLWSKYYHHPRYMSGMGAFHSQEVKAAQERARGQMTDEEKSAYEAYRIYIQQQDADYGRGRSGSTSSGSPAATDQSSRQTELLEKMVGLMESGLQMNVQTEDVGGRLLGRQSSLAKPVEQLYDTPLNG